MQHCPNLARELTILLAALLLWTAPPTARAQAAPREILRLGAWLVEWDLDRGMAEWHADADLFDAVRLFAASFREGSDSPVLAPALEARLAECRELARTHGTELWLSVVNDVIRADGSVELKSPALVRRLLADEASRDRHAEDLFSLARATGVAGIELDYENVGVEDFPRLLSFARELSAKLDAAGVGVRVVLQPGRRWLEQGIPEGLSASIMAYNLYGLHSEPGPKATAAFVRETAELIPGGADPERVSLALATGGFVWEDGAKPKSLTEIGALALAKESNARIERTFFGRYAHFTIPAQAGSARREVWFADAESLTVLWEAAWQNGFRALDIWRLGGNAPSLFAALRTLKRPAGRAAGN